MAKNTWALIIGVSQIYNFSASGCFPPHHAPGAWVHFGFPREGADEPRSGHSAHRAVGSMSCLFMDLTRHLSYSSFGPQLLDQSQA